MKKILAACLITLCLIGLAAAPSMASEWTWSRRIDIIIPHGEGGGVDTTTRALAPFLERELGVPMVITNITGANGLVGTAHMISQPADGYTFAFVSPSPLIAAILGSATFDFFAETVFVANIVHDVNILWVRADSPFNTWQDFEDYARANPGELTISMSTLMGSDGASVIPLIRGAGLIDAVTMLAYDGAEPTIAVINGEATASVGVYTYGRHFMQAGEIKPLIAFTERRMSTLPDLQTTVELGFNATHGGFQHIIAKRGTPQGAIDAMASAIERISSDPDWIAWKVTNSLTDRQGFRNAEDLTTFVDEWRAMITEAFDDL
jgi:tripartite-type tricarboxylate transporter receptor subunit TctC